MVIRHPSRPCNRMHNARGRRPPAYLSFGVSRMQQCSSRAFLYRACFLLIVLGARRRPRLPFVQRGSARFIETWTKSRLSVECVYDFYKSHCEL